LNLAVTKRHFPSGLLVKTCGDRTMLQVSVHQEMWITITECDGA